ncbi:MAG: type II toxin-antitoxin system RelE family toxin, partial [Actinomycetes bacterium]
MARVVLTADAREDVRDLDGSARKLVLRALKKLEDDPLQRGQPLGSGKDNLTGYRKLVVGNRDYRVIYRVERDGTVVVVWVIGSRTDGECYALATARMKLAATDPEVAAEMEQLIERAWEAVREK